ncbi:MAG: MMPL family transporter [Bacteroidia bacterium]
MWWECRILSIWRTRYLFEIKLGKTREEALRATMKEIGLAVFLTSLTTTIGFASLLVSNVPPIREFGLFAAIGVMFTWFISVVIMPNALMWLKPEVFVKTGSFENHPMWKRILLWVNQLTSRRSPQVMAGTAILLGVCIFLIFRIPLTTFLIEDIGDKDPIRKSMVFLRKSCMD